MKKALLISALMFAAFLAMVYSPTTMPEFTVEFKTPSAKPIDLKSAKLLDDAIAIGLEGISADENVAAGLYEVAYSLESLEPDPEQIKAIESALGVRVSVDLRSRTAFGRNNVWTAGLQRLTSQNPILRRYLQRHQRILDQLSSIVNRKHFANAYYSPDQGSDQSLVKALIPLASTCREHVRTLGIRTRVALAEDRIGDAIIDVNTIHQLGHHLMRDGGTRVEVFVGTAIAIAATEHWCELLSHPELSLNELAEISKLVNSAPLISGVKALDVFERLTVLQLAENMERFGAIGAKRVLGTGSWHHAEDALLPTIGMAFTDWLDIYNEVNRHFDAHVEVLTISDDEDRRNAITALDNSFDDLFKLVEDQPNQQSLANRAVWGFIDELFFDSAATALWALESARQRNEALKLCIALKRFHFDQNRYPASLEELEGKYLDKIPVDYRTGKAMGYSPLKSGALVYTTGKNGEDNQGWGYRNLSNTYRSPYDDETYLLGQDDRTPPGSMKKIVRQISGRTVTGFDRYDWNRERLSLAGEHVSLSEFTKICSIEELTWLDLSLSDLPDKWYHLLPKLKNLEVLSLVGEELTEEMMSHIATLPALHTLVLNGTTINGNLSPIAGHPNLKSLLLARSSVTDDDLLVLRTLPNLRTLNLSETQVSDAAGPVLAELRDLAHLQLCGTNITDKTLAEISELTELLVLRVDYTAVTNIGVASLKDVRLQTLGLIGTGVNNDISELLAGQSNLRSVFLYETDFNSEITETGKAVNYFERPSGVVVDKQHEVSHPVDTEPTKWGKLVGVQDGYEILQDENPLQIRLTASQAGDNTGGPTATGSGVSVLNSIKGDFDISVRIRPDWELHDEIMTNECAGTRGYRGGPFLGAGLLIQQSEGHYLKWSWTSICSRSLQVYSRITPEYFIYPFVKNDPLTDFTFNVLGTATERRLRPSGTPNILSYGVSSAFDVSALTAYPDSAIEGPLKHFDHLSVGLRLRRQGNKLTAFSSKDGESWTFSSEMNTHFTDEVQVGIWCGKLSVSDYEFHFEDFTIKQ